jgi:hypothetical protein
MGATEINPSDAMIAVKNQRKRGSKEGAVSKITGERSDKS